MTDDPSLEEDTMGKSTKTPKGKKTAAMKDLAAKGDKAVKGGIIRKMGG